MSLVKEDSVPRKSNNPRSSIIRRKIQRLRDGGVVRTLDLFAGCGGLSLGFRAAGFEIVGAVENDPLAVASHAINFHPDVRFGNDNPHALARDLTATSPAELISDLRLGRSTTNAVDVMIGGPPCQAFARVGRAKLREIDQHPTAFLRDHRANLYLRYLQYVREMCPLAGVMENVPDALNFGGHNICEEICEVLASEGYVCGYSILNAAYYGVPQMRERMFLFAYRRELRCSVEFPVPTHFVKLPPGYHGTRAVALKTLQHRRLIVGPRLFPDDHYFIEPLRPDKNLPTAITARQATDDLPAITGHLNGTIKRGARRFSDAVYYRSLAKLNLYCELMRSWPGFAAKDGIVDHVIRSLPRDYRIFRRMLPGDQYPEAYLLANRIFEARIARLSRSGIDTRPGTKEYEQLKRKYVPPYDPKKFPNKWRKMEADLPARTLLAHLGKDSYSHIHYDSEQARTISVREAARLQSFPDGFRFVGTMNPAFRQIGNAVPPLLSNAVAHCVLAALGVDPSRPLLSGLLCD